MSSSLKKKLRSELEVSNYLNELGFFTRFHLDFYPVENLRTKKDISIFGVKFNEELTHINAIFDISENDDDFSHLFKLYGLKKYFHNCQSYLISKNRHERMISFSKKIDINYISFEKLKQMYDGVLKYNIEKISSTDGLKILRNIKQIYEISPLMFWSYHNLWLENDPYSKLYQQQKVFASTSEILSDNYSDPISWFRREMFLLSQISLIQIASDCKNIDDGLLSSYVESKLLSNGSPFDLKRKLADNINILIDEIKKIGLNVNLNDFTVRPKYVPELIMLIKKIHKYSRYIQYYLSENENMHRKLIKKEPVNIVDYVNAEDYKSIIDMNELTLKILHAGPIKYDFNWFL